MSKSRLSKHAFNCGLFLSVVVVVFFRVCAPHAYVNVNVIAFQQNEHKGVRNKTDAAMHKE